LFLAGISLPDADLCLVSTGGKLTRAQSLSRFGRYDQITSRDKLVSGRDKLTRRRTLPCFDRRQAYPTPSFVSFRPEGSLPDLNLCLVSTGGKLTRPQSLSRFSSYDQITSRKRLVSGRNNLPNTRFDVKLAPEDLKWSKSNTYRPPADLPLAGTKGSRLRGMRLSQNFEHPPAELGLT